MNLKCILNVQNDNKCLEEYRNIYNVLKEKYGEGEYKRFKKYGDDSNIFENYSVEHRYARNIHRGKIRDGIVLSELELSMICDDGFSHFGGSSTIYSDNTFKVEIEID